MGWGCSVQNLPDLAEENSRLRGLQNEHLVARQGFVQYGCAAALVGFLDALPMVRVALE